MKHAIIIGAAKCGTTSLYNSLIEHPQICQCLVKEPQWFASGHRSNISRTYGAYEDLWPGYDPEIHKYVLEASTGYTKSAISPDSAKRIYDAMPTAKMIYVTRDPKERNASHKQMRINAGYHEMPDSFYESVSDYKLQLSYYYEYFNKEQILILEFEDLIHENFDFKIIWDFLEIESCNVKLPHLNKTINAS